MCLVLFALYLNLLHPAGARSGEAMSGAGWDSEGAREGRRWRWEPKDNSTKIREQQCSSKSRPWWCRPTLPAMALQALEAEVLG